MLLLIALFLQGPAQNVDRGPYISASYTELGSDLSAYDPILLLNLGYNFRTGTNWSVRLEGEGSLALQDRQVDVYGLGVLAEWKSQQGFYLFLGGAITQYRWKGYYRGYDFTGLTHSLGFGYRFGSHLRIFARGDYFLEGQTEDQSIQFNNESIEVSQLRAGITYQF